MMTDAVSDQNTTAGDSQGRLPENPRKRLFMALTLAVILAGALATGWWLLERANYVTTNNAYVDSSVANVMAQTEGTIADVPVANTQAVEKGDVLVVLDDADARIALAQAEARHGAVMRRVRQYFELNREAEAQVALAQALLNQAKIDLDRRQSLQATKSISQEDLTNAQAAYDTALAAVAVARGKQQAQKALTFDTDVKAHPEVLEAKAAVDAARLALERTTIRAPIGGIVVDKKATLGQRVEVGSPVMSIVPLDQMFVNANFKENQLPKVRTGQPVTLTADLYGPDVVYHGKVAGLGAGTGSAFAIIPAQNATGSWIKVVQRLPVKILLRQDELREHPLRVGLSMNVKVDIRG